MNASAHRTRVGLIAWVAWYLLMLGAGLLACTGASGQTLPTSFDYTKRAKDGRLYQLPVRSKDTLWLKVRADGHVVSEPSLKPWPYLLWVKLDFTENRERFNAQGQPAEKGTTWRYRLDGGPWQNAIWQHPVSPGIHRLEVEFSRPGHPTEYIIETFNGPGVTPTRPPGGGAVVPKPKPDDNRTDGRDALTLGGIEHRNWNGQVDHGEYVLQYRDMPGSTKFRYTPRIVLKEYTTSHDLQIHKLRPFDLARNDLAMYFSKAQEGDFEKLLERGWTHINSRDVFGAGHGDVTNPNRPGRNIPWTRRAHMTQPNNFDWLPKFQAGEDLTDAELTQLLPWVLGDGVSNYFTDGQPPQWHLWDWEFKYNRRTWSWLADQYRLAYGVSRFIQSWMGHGQIGFDQQSRYDAWNLVSYYHLVDFNFSQARIASAIDEKGNVVHRATDDEIARWKRLWHNDAHNLLQSIAKGEWYSAEHPRSKMVQGYMPSYEDRGGDLIEPRHFPWYKLPPHLAESTPIWWMLTSRIDPDLEGGIVLWNSPLKAEPLTSEQYTFCGLGRLAFHNDLRNARYEWKVPEVSYDGGQTYRPQAEVKGNKSFSALNFRQERNGQVVREPVFRCLVTPTHIAVYAQQPYPDAPPVQTVKIRVPGIIDDFVTVHNVRQTYAGEDYVNRELTMAIATR